MLQLPTVRGAGAFAGTAGAAGCGSPGTGLVVTVAAMHCDGGLSSTSLGLLWSFVHQLFVPGKLYSLSCFSISRVRPPESSANCPALNTGAPWIFTVGELPP